MAALRRELPFEQECLDDRYAQEADMALDGVMPEPDGATGPVPSFAGYPANDGSRRLFVEQRRRSRQLACASATASGPAGKRKRSVSS